MIIIKIVRGLNEIELQKIYKNTDFTMIASYILDQRDVGVESPDAMGVCTEMDRFPAHPPSAIATGGQYRVKLLKHMQLSR